MVSAIGSVNGPLTAPGIQNISAMYRVHNNENPISIRKVDGPTQHLHVLTDAPRNFIVSARQTHEAGTYREGANSQAVRSEVAGMQAQNAAETVSAMYQAMENNGGFIAGHLDKLVQDNSQFMSAEDYERLSAVAQGYRDDAPAVEAPVREQAPVEAQTPPPEMRAAAMEHAPSQARQAQAAPPPQPQERVAETRDATQPERRPQQQQNRAPDVQQNVREMRRAMQPFESRMQEASQADSRQPQQAQTDVQRQASTTGAPAVAMVV